MKKNKFVKAFSLILALLLFCGVSFTAFAAEAPDITRKCSVSVTMKNDGRPVPGGTLTLYNVAALKNENGDLSYVWNDAFSSCGLGFDNISSPEFAAKLAYFAGENGIKGTERGIDINGRVSFKGLTAGLYLAVQENPAEGYDKIEPFAVTLPLLENDEWKYDADATPKTGTEGETQPSEPGTTEPDEPELPYTGQLYWPVFVLLAVGVIVFATGFNLSRRRKCGDEK